MRDFYGAKDVYTGFSELQVIQTEYTSQDGVKVNVSIIKTPEYIGVRPAPVLFKGFICEMPILNPSRLEHGNFSNNYNLDFGSAEDASEAEHLYAMDPLLNINLKEKLPNVLIISAGNDDRVDGFQMFKSVAALQRFEAAESAYLYNDPDAGLSEVADLYNVYGMVFGFAEHITK